jgi:hypothetical protein
MNREIVDIQLIAQRVHTVSLDDIDHEQVASDIELYAVNIQQESPEYGWISRGFVQHEDLVMPVTPEITKLENAVLDTIKQLTGREYKIDDTWSVRLVKNQSVIAHSHHSNLHLQPDEYYSIAYYPQVPEGSAELIFSADWCGIRQAIVSVVPKRGLLVIFNSYITHMTARQQVDETRIVVSMNLSPVEPTQSPNADWSVYWDRPVIDSPKSIHGS